ncbi:hypothetical protein H6G93_09305 [Nostoc sp. FACHB-973]|nr:hypothetical protein [Nostoc sp. FACHB-973]
MRIPLTNGDYSEAVSIVDAAGVPQVQLESLLRQSLGKFGSVVTTNTSAVTGSFCAISPLEPSVFSSLTMTNQTGSLAGLTIQAGQTIYGDISGYTLVSGRVIAYRSA